MSRAVRVVGLVVMWGAGILGTANLIVGNHAVGIGLAALAVATAAHLRMERSASPVDRPRPTDATRCEDYDG
ncbi:hypothetical protein [Amycolatopsis pigmentata]|uniref:Uncharacterized protein n=1 Tax=Amycolatopsis pigmentata TaxID=450801 RepID=A0ABW5G406_9PSEU